MAIIEQNTQPFKPYARLMNVLGDQLITDKKVAVIEVIKNCYDADAENVQIRFFNMQNYGIYLTEKELMEEKITKEKLTEKGLPYIEIEDNGDGMALDIIKNVWLCPATPNKLDKKRRKQNITKKGRVIQGEKGIGRFAVHKLGEKIDLYTKALGEHEIKLEMNFTEYDPEKINLFNQPPAEYKFLDDVNNSWYVNEPAEEIKEKKGTLIRIYNLREKWNDNDIKELFKSIQRLIPPIDKNAENLGINFQLDFKVFMYINKERYTSEDTTTFTDVIERAQFTMIGEVSSKGILKFNYKSTSPLRNFEKEINLLSKESLSEFNYPSKTIEEWFIEYKREPNCGGFKFSFYAFSLNSPDKIILTKDIENFIKNNFVYLLRDGVRVYPFGEKGYDWLDLDKLRAQKKAGDYISYNDLTGFVYIENDNNPQLKDSTNRQGLMNIDGAYEDFKRLVTQVTQILNIEKKIDENKLKIMRKKPFKDTNDIIVTSFNILKSELEKIDNKAVLEKASKFLNSVQKHTALMKERMETVENLAGLGMAVEKSSHDALMLLSKMRNNVKDFAAKARYQDYNNEELVFFLKELDDNLIFVYDEMQVIQPLFKNQRKTIKDVSVCEAIEKVVKYFRRDIDGKINIKIFKDNDIIVKTNAGLILQILINLLDNAIYWVNQNESKQKEILFKLNSESRTIIIADNGPGIRDDVMPLIFSEFFSLKSEGRGLGLYIVKEILLRIDGEVFVVQEENEKLLSGANIIIKFNQEQ